MGIAKDTDEAPPQPPQEQGRYWRSYCCDVFSPEIIIPAKQKIDVFIAIAVTLAVQAGEGDGEAKGAEEGEGEGEEREDANLPEVPGEEEEDWQEPALEQPPPMLDLEVRAVVLE